VTIDAEVIEKFARKHWKENKQVRWNGRQIRNAFYTAVAMVEFSARNQKAEAGYNDHKDVKINVRKAEFEKIASTAREFDVYMTETMGTSFDFKASKDGLRKQQREQKEKAKKKKKIRNSPGRRSTAIRVQIARVRTTTMILIVTSGQGRKN
jgi:hypothetical protein